MPLKYAMSLGYGQARRFLRRLRIFEDWRTSRAERARGGRLPALQPRHYARLEPYLAALPSDSLLNLNTVPVEVLVSLLAGVNAASLEQVLLSRRQRPFISVEDFILRSSAAFSLEPLAEEEELRFAVGSAWFHADIVVQLEDRTLTRQTIIYRRPLPYGPHVAYRIGGET